MNDLLEASLKKMIIEVFEGAPNPKETWFTNNEPNSGIFGALDGISADEASIFVNGTTLAAHANHIRYHMWGTNELLRSGNYPKMDWEHSWATTLVDKQRWIQIREDLQIEYSELLVTLDQIDWSELLANELLGSLAHSAYHLGAIRQMLKIVEKR